jgi:Ras-related protein Rab-7A
MVKNSLKIILLGDSNVGKTSIIKRFTKNEFSLTTMATVSGGLTVKQVDLGPSSIELQIWDTAGQERFASLSRLFFRNCHACIIVFDLSNPHSFESVKGWSEEFHEFGGYEPNKAPPVFLVGNKIDLKKSQKFSMETMMKLVKKENFYNEIFLISASKDTQVNELFEIVAHAAQNYAKSLVVKEGSKSDNETLKEKQEDQGSCCS